MTSTLNRCTWSDDGDAPGWTEQYLMTGGKTYGQRLPGQDGRNLKVSLHKCPNCGNEVEIFSVCNALVCLAVWMCYSARSTTDRILAIIPADHRFCSGRLRAQCGQHVFHPHGTLYQGGCSGLVLDGRPQDRGRLRHPHLGQVLHGQPHPGDHR